jgi:23S rRNA pseudouridine1911/1915/1917 synthase
MVPGAGFFGKPLPAARPHSADGRIVSYCAAKGDTMAKEAHRNTGSTPAGTAGAGKTAPVSTAPKPHAGSSGFTVTEAMGLLECLIARMPERSRTAVKGLLQAKRVLVDGQNISQFDHPLTAGQRITIVKEADAPVDRAAAKAARRKWSKTGTAGLGGLAILHEDDQVIVVSKPAGLLSMGSDTEKTQTAHRFLADYVRSGDPDGRIFIVHRLDRDTSGVMLFARSQEIQKRLQSDWAATVHERRYVALVEGRLEGGSGTLRSWLKENRAQVVYVSPQPGEGQEAITHWRRLGGNQAFTLVELNLETGRKNQIRVQMQEIGHPVAGDVKYGGRTNPARRLCLHAQSIGFIHPATGKLMRFEVPCPPAFKELAAGD